MIAYPDTSFLCAFYRKQVNSPRAAAHFAQMPEALHVASPLLFEFRQSVRWQVFLHAKDSSKGYDRSTAQASLAKLQGEIAIGAVVVVPIDWADVVSIAERLSAQHTWTEGYRGFDVLHVATALHLGATEFLTFDSRQKVLAKAEGLIAPL
ncbi:MAG: PilT protein domain protein [Verrucomicrobiales bacterium]|nr:PilT protein domain protein [Verrucomicrobiales bacterium]